MDRIYIPTKLNFSEESRKQLGIVRRLVRGEAIDEENLSKFIRAHSVNSDSPYGLIPKAQNPYVFPVAYASFKQLTQRRALKGSFSSAALFTKLAKTIQEHKPRVIDVDPYLLASHRLYYRPAYVRLDGRYFKPLLTYSSQEYDRLLNKKDDVVTTVRKSVTFFFDLLVLEPERYEKIVMVMREVFGV